MAIRAGMSLKEAIEQLTKGFIKFTGRQPEALEKIKIKQEALQKIKDLNKVVSQSRSLHSVKYVIKHSNLSATHYTF